MPPELAAPLGLPASPAVGLGVERSEIRPGDHIYTWRAVYAYSHHGTLIDPLPMVPHEF